MVFFPWSSLARLAVDGCGRRSLLARCGSCRGVGGGWNNAVICNSLRLRATVTIVPLALLYLARHHGLPVHVFEVYKSFTRAFTTL